MLEEAISWEGQLILEIYQKGIEGGLRNSIVELSYEAYQTLLAGFNCSPIVLSGEALHRLNCECILQYTQSIGEIEYSKKRFTLQSSQILGDYEASYLLMNKFTLYDTIIFLEEQQLIDRESVLDMHALRYLRNNAVHASTQIRIDPHSPEIEFDVKKNVMEALLGGSLPLELRKHKIKIRDSGQELDYVIDQQKLGIEIEKVSVEQRLTVVSLALLFTSMKKINQLLSQFSAEIKRGGSEVNKQTD